MAERTEAFESLEWTERVQVWNKLEQIAGYEFSDLLDWDTIPRTTIAYFWLSVLSRGGIFIIYKRQDWV